MRLKSLFFFLSLAVFLPGAGCETLDQVMGDSYSDSGSSGGAAQPARASQTTPANGVQVASVAEAGQTAGASAGGNAGSNGGVGKTKFRKTIAVSRFEQRAKWRSKWAMGSGMADQLADALVNSNRFVVVERQTLSDVIAEQNLAAGPRMAKSQTAKIGKIVPAQILVKGTVTEFEEKSSASGSGFSFGGLSLGSDAAEAHVAIIIRIINSTTGTIIASERVEGKAKSGGTTFGIRGGGVGFKSSGFKKTPLGKAVQIVIDRAVVKITQKLDHIPFEGKVIKVSGDIIYTNAGGRNGVELGNTFTVFAPGEELIDPDTGESLGTEKTEVGKITITSVKEKFSKASLESGSGVGKGYIIEE